MNAPNILLVDDTPDNLRLLSTMLIEQGYEVRCVINGPMALMGAKAEPPDLILLDINMPQMNGYEVCQCLKADAVTKEIPIIFISGLEDVLDKVKAFSLGGIDYITKPFQVEEVLVRIETHLTISRLRQQLQDQNQQLKQEIIERKQAEEKFTKAFRASPNPIAIVIKESEKILDINPSFLRLTGYNINEVIAESISRIWTGNEKEAISNSIKQINSVKGVYNQEVGFVTKFGEFRTILLSLEEIELAGLKCALLIANDITARKRLEHEFISLVSHELKTPLTSLIGSLDLLASSQANPISSTENKLLQIAINNAERLMGLINDILNLERLQSGQIPLDKKLCNAENIMLEATQTMEAMAIQAGVKLINETKNIEFQADPERLLQVFTNLLNNAIKFSAKGHQVWFNVELTEDGIIFIVKDQGRGIPSDKLTLIFERFQQVDVSDARSKGGTGLGLSICRYIVQQHRGKIWVESTLNQGSSFFVWIPLVGTEP